MTNVVIYVPGLGDNAGRQALQSILLWKWRAFYNIHTRYFAARWHNSPGEDFSAKLRRLLKVIDAELAQGHTVSLIGASAGASLALNAFTQRPQLSAAISVCGKLRNPQTISARTFTDNPAFKPSIEHFMAAEPALTDNQRARILLVRPQNDAVVPTEDNWVRGAVITRLPSSGHALSILASLTIFSRRLVRFIRDAKSA